MGRLFGTNGVRGIVGEDMVPELALRLGRAMGTHFRRGDLVAVGMDARTSSPLLADAVVAGLCATGVDVVELGVCPSPAIQFFVKSHPEVAAGVIITASHNPPQFNGIKMVSGDGTEAGAEQEQAVEAIFDSQKFRRTAWSEVGTASRDDTANAAYRKAVVAGVDAKSIRRRAFKVVIDPAGGPGGLVSPRVLEDLGCKVVGIHVELDGAFSGRPSEPVEKNLARLLERVQAEKADLGVAHDGDADRCIFVDEKGRFVPGDESFAIVARHILERDGPGVLCTPVSTSSLVLEVAKEAAGQVEQTAVGAPIVSRRMLETNAVFGGEENGGLIFPRLQHCRDAAMSMASMLEVLATSGKTLSALRAELPEFHTVKSAFECPNAQKPLLLTAIKRHYKAAKGTRLDETDGLKIVHGNGDWVLIRPSGTEPIYRVYAESRDAKRAKDLADETVRQAAGLLKKIPA